MTSQSMNDDTAPPHVRLCVSPYWSSSAWPCLFQPHFRSLGEVLLQHQGELSQPAHALLSQQGEVECRLSDWASAVEVNMNESEGSTLRMPANWTGLQCGGQCSFLGFFGVEDDLLSTFSRGYWYHLPTKPRTNQHPCGWSQFGH